MYNIGTGYSGLYKNTAGNLKPPHLMEELKKSGEKFTEEDVVMITKTKKGELVWLEKGNDNAGLKHILDRHKSDFKNIGINKGDIPNLIKKAIESGIVIGTQGKRNPRTIYELNFVGNKVKVAISISDNGYIVGANPR